MRIFLGCALLLLLLPASAPADFSRSDAVLHPAFPGSGPFIIEISGTWPTDCHPGEQKPVVESFDGQTVEIGFEIIVVHITCNDTDTPYRVLVDMSESVRTGPSVADRLRLRAQFQGETFEQTLDVVCPDDASCETGDATARGAEPGLYFSPALANQGLLVARQGTGTAIYPLVYDESGKNEWLYAGGHMVEDTFFAEVLRLSGGDCFGCEPTGVVPAMTPAGHLTVLAESPGLLQVKSNDGLFVEYQSLVFGYHTFGLGPDGAQTLIDLAGRWGISENRGTDPPLGDLTEFIPGAFDLRPTDAAETPPGSALAGQVSYRLSSPDGVVLGDLVCKGDVAPDGSGAACDFIDPTDAAEPLFRFYQQGPYRLAIEYARPVIAIGTPPGGQAVRLD
jgi:hypothetical protein